MCYQFPFASRVKQGNRDLSETLLPIGLRVYDTLVCAQMGQNKACPGSACRFFKKAQGGLKLILPQQRDIRG